MEGGDGDDRFTLGAGLDRIDGGEGIDTLAMAGPSLSFGGGLPTSRSLTAEGEALLSATRMWTVETVIDLGSGTFRGTTFSGVENVIGSSGADAIIGDAAGNRLEGLGGADRLYGLGGEDDLHGGAGDDTLDGGSGDDDLHGGAGADRLYGGDGDDTLSGGLGMDVLEGGDGDDTLIGGRDRDFMLGGDGADRFVFSFASDSPNLHGGFDVIGDFRASEDVLDFSGIDANTTIAGDQAFTLVQSGAGAGLMRLFSQDGRIFVEGHVDGDGVADIVVSVNGPTVLNAGDIVL